MSIVIYRRTGTAKYNHEQTQHQQSQEIGDYMADIALESPLNDEHTKESSGELDNSMCDFEGGMKQY